MILDAFGPDALPLLMAGGFGGLCRGVVAFDPKAFSRATVIEITRAIIVGSGCSLFAHGIVLAFAGGWFEALHIEPGTELGLSGFVAGIIGISIVSGLVTYANNRNVPPPPPAPPADAVGDKP